MDITHKLTSGGRIRFNQLAVTVADIVAGSTKLYLQALPHTLVQTMIRIIK